MPMFQKTAMPRWLRCGIIWNSDTEAHHSLVSSSVNRSKLQHIVIKVWRLLNNVHISSYVSSFKYDRKCSSKLRFYYSSFLRCFHNRLSVEKTNARKDRSLVLVKAFMILDIERGYAAVWMGLVSFTFSICLRKSRISSFSSVLSRCCKYLYYYFQLL